MEKLEWTVPLWKMKISQTQYDSLKEELHIAFSSNDVLNLKPLAKEAALYYAEWWRREYNGKKTSSALLAESLGLPEENSDDLYQLARKGGKILGIPIVTRQNRLWFRSLLMQGGLPMKHIQSNKENIDVYKLFLLGLIKHTESVLVDWNDSSFIENLSCTNYLPGSFKNESIYELSLLIARAIYEKNDELLPYDSEEGEWKELTKELKESSGRQKTQAAPFIFRWKIYKHENNLNLSYNISVAKKLQHSYVVENGLDDCYSFSLFVQNQQIASYVKSMNNEFICRDSKFKDFQWNNENVISLRIKKDNNELIDITAPNCFAPDIENPLLLAESENYWSFRSGTSNTGINAVLFPTNWIIEEKFQTVKLGDLALNWCEFKDEIKLKNTETGEEQIFNDTSTTYTCEFLGWASTWIEASNHKVLTSKPRIRIFNESNNMIPATNIQIKRYRQGNWTAYDEYNIPIGLLEFKVNFPDGSYVRERFYHTGPLNCSFNEMNENFGKIKWNWEKGNISPARNQENLEIQELGNSSWKISRQNNSTIYPGTTKFSLFPNLKEVNSPPLELSIASPFSGVVLLNPEGFEIKNNQVLCLSSLFGYRYIVMGSTVKTIISHDEDHKIRIKGELKQGIYSLSRFENDIKELFLLFGSDPFKNESRVMIRIGEKTVYIKEYNLVAFGDNSTKTISVFDNKEDKNKINYQSKIYAIPVDCKGKDIAVEELEKDGESFTLPDEATTQKFILFSEKYAGDQLVPRYIDFSENPYQVEENSEGLSPQEINILRIRDALEKSDAYESDFLIADEWNKVIEYFKIVMSHSLPFKTLDCFRAIAHSPRLMVKLTCLLWISQGVNQDDLLQGLARFENELAVSYHWIKDEDWNETICNWLFLELNEGLQKVFIMDLIKKKVALLDFTLHTETGELINILSQEGESIDIMPPAPTKAEIQGIRAQIGGNRNLPNNLVLIPNEWKQLFPMAMKSDLPIYIKALLMAPVKSALAMTGNDDSIWESKHLKMRRTINFYRHLKPVEYYELLMCMVKRILKTASN